MSTDNSVIDELNVYESPEISTSITDSIKSFAIAEYLKSDNIVASSRENWNSEARKGGNRLQAIFTLAGASPEYARRCPRITREAMDAWIAEDRVKLNEIDIGSWCGILAWSIYKKTGAFLDFLTTAILQLVDSSLNLAGTNPKKRKKYYFNFCVNT